MTHVLDVCNLTSLNRIATASSDKHVTFFDATTYGRYTNPNPVTLKLNLKLTLTLTLIDSKAEGFLEIPGRPYRPRIFKGLRFLSLCRRPGIRPSLCLFRIPA